MTDIRVYVSIYSIEELQQKILYHPYFSNEINRQKINERAEIIEYLSNVDNLELENFSGKYFHTFVDLRGYKEGLLTSNNLIHLLCKTEKEMGLCFEIPADSKFLNGYAKADWYHSFGFGPHTSAIIELQKLTEALVLKVLKEKRLPKFVISIRNFINEIKNKN